MGHWWDGQKVTTTQLPTKFGSQAGSGSIIGLPGPAQMTDKLDQTNGQGETDKDLKAESDHGSTPQDSSMGENDGRNRHVSGLAHVVPR